MTDPRLPPRRVQPSATDGHVLTTVSGEATWAAPTGGGGGGIQSIVAGANITVDNTDPANPIISATSGGGGGGAAFSGVKVKYSADKLATGIGSWAFLPGWDVEIFDTDNYHNPTTNADRLVAPTAGYYMLAAHVDAASTSLCALAFVLNAGGATQNIPGLRGDSGGAYGTQVAGIAYLNAGDYVRVSMYSSAGSLTLSGANSAASMHRIG